MVAETGSDILLEQDDRWSNAEWEEEEQLQVTCLVCPHKETLMTNIFSHMLATHSLDLLEIKSLKKLDFFGLIKLVNYTRAQDFTGGNFSAVGSIRCHIINNFEQWIKDDAFLIPQLQDDPLLFSIQEDEEDEDEYCEDADDLNTGDDSFVDLAQETSNDPKQLQDIIAHLTQQLALSESNHAKLKNSYESYKEMVETTFMTDAVKTVLKSNSEEEKQGEQATFKSRNDNGNYYFESYAGNEIHESMLRDAIRTEGYRDFCYHNKHYLKGKVVLDVGCGTGILSMFAAKAGAAKVIAVDNSDIILKAEEIVKENKLDHIITFVRGKVEDIELPIDKVDVIISEWMGYFLLFEGMLDSVVYARDRWLTDSGLMAPSKMDILLAAFGDEEWYNDKVHFWNDVYGFSMNAMNSDIKNNGVVTVLPGSGMISDSLVIKSIDTKSTTVKQLDFTSTFQLSVNREGKIYGICGWFDTIFSGDGIDQVSFSTSPHTVPTHWMQTLFLFQQPISCDEGDVLSGSFSCSKSMLNPRELVVKIDWTQMRLNHTAPVATGSQTFGVV